VIHGGSGLRRSRCGTFLTREGRVGRRQELARARDVERAIRRHRRSAVAALCAFCVSRRSRASMARGERGSAWGERALLLRLPVALPSRPGSPEKLGDLGRSACEECADHVSHQVTDELANPPLELRVPYPRRAALAQQTSRSLRCQMINAHVGRPGAMRMPWVRTFLGPRRPARGDGLDPHQSRLTGRSQDGKGGL
jgi:hypothetical protein